MASAPSARSLVAHAKWVGLAHAVGQLSWYAVYLLLAAVLPPQAFGTVAAGLAIVGAAALVMQSGTAGSLIAAPQVTRHDVVAGVRFNVGVGLAMTILIVATAGPLTNAVAEGGDADVIAVLGITVTLAALGVVPSALLRKAMLFKANSLATAGATLVTAVGAVVALVLGAGVWALVVRQLLLHTVAAALLWRFALDPLRRLDELETTSGSRRPAHRWAFFAVSVSFFAALSFDTLLVGAGTDATQLGFYAVAFTLGFAPLTQLAWVVGQVLFPAAAATTDIDEVGRRTQQVLRLTTLLLLPLVPVAAVLAQPVLTGLLGDEWVAAVLPFSLLLTAGTLHAIVNPIGEALAGTGNMPFRARCDAAWAVVTLSAVGVLAVVAGIDGAAVAHVVCIVPLVAAYVILGGPRVGMRPRRAWAAVRDIVLAVAVQALATWTVAAALSADGRLLPSLVAALVGLGVAAAALLFSPSKPLHDGLRSIRLTRAGAAAGEAA